MNIKRIIDKNGKLIWYIALIIVFSLLAIKSLNAYYEKDEERKRAEINENKNTASGTQDIVISEYTTVSNSIDVTMASFANYCNNREIENAYKMLTDECKNAMFPTVDDFEKFYINTIYNEPRTYDLVKWSTEGNKSTYLVTLYGDILATGGIDNSTQEYYTFVEDNNGTYKLNVNNYIYGEKRNLIATQNMITIKIGNVDIYEKYEEATITVTNKTSKRICLTGNKYQENIYLENTKETTYSSLNSEFDSQEIVLTPNSARTFKVQFNKGYSLTNKAKYLVLSDVILDYDDYLNCEDKINYANRTSIKMKYKK